VESNRAYGLAMCLLVLSFGTIWRVVQSPTRGRIIWAGVVSILFLHCVYYDAVFLCAILFGAALILACRGQWKGLAALAGVSALAGSTMITYVPILRRASLYAPTIQEPFDLSRLWYKLGEALTACSSSQPSGANRPEIGVWILLVATGIICALVLQIRRYRSARGPTLANQTAASAASAQQGADLALFSIVSMLCGVAGHIGFLLKLQYPTQPWYYVGMLSLCAVSLEGILTANWPGLRPWGLLRIGFVMLIIELGAKSVWEEAHTRRSNADLVADVLGRKAEKGDLIVVNGAWEGITFDRYYQGSSRWVTVPPIDSHKVHRSDIMWEKMNQLDPMGPVLAEISTTLRNGKKVWVVGHLPLAKSRSLAPAAAPPQWSARHRLGEYMLNWSIQLTAHVSSRSLEMKFIEVPATRPVNLYENLPLMRFSGYQPGREEQPRATDTIGIRKD